MTNQFLNAQIYSNVMLLLLKNQLVYGRLVDGQFKDQVSDENGLTVNVKRPPRFIDKKDGTANLATQDVVTGSAPVVVDQYSKVHISIGDIEYVQSYNALMQNETMKSAASTLAHSVDSFIAGKTLLFASWVQGANTTDTNSSINTIKANGIIQNPSQASGAHSRLMSQGVPNADLNAVVSFNDGEKVRGSLTGSFLPPGINVPALQRVKIPVISEIDWYASQQCPVLTTGTRTQGNGTSTGYQIDTANQNVNYRDVKGSAGVVGMTQSLVLKSGDNALTIALGEVFAINSVYSWDWRANGGKGQANDQLQQFTVIDDGSHPNGYTTAAGGGVTIKISPAIIVQGTADATGSTDTNTAFATVDSIPLSNSYVVWVGAASTKLRVRSAFHKRAISLVSTRLQMPFTGTASYAVDPDTGIAIRYWRGSDITTGAHVHRWDMMYGGAVLDQFLGTRVVGKDN